MKNIVLAGGLAAVSPSRIREIADVAFGMDGVSPVMQKCTKNGNEKCTTLPGVTW